MGEQVFNKDTAISIQENSGQIAIGTYVVQIGSVHGGVVHIALPAQHPQPRPRLTPVLLRPRRLSGLLDRSTETNLALAILPSGQPVEFYAQPGWGKTSLLRHLAYELPLLAFPDGLVYLPARQQAPADLLQALYDAFYECDLPSKPSQTQLQHALQDRQALVILDDVELAREGVEQVLDTAPRCTFLLASPQRRLWGEGRAVALPGLPPDDALALLTRELGRPLTAAERPHAPALGSLLQGQPLHLLQAAALIREERCSLAELVEHLGHGIPAEALALQTLGTLSEPEQRVVGALALLDSSVGEEHLAGLTGLADPAPVVERLLQRYLVQAHSPRYSLTGSLARDWASLVSPAGPLDQALAHFTSWAEQHRLETDRLLPDMGAMVQLFDQAVQTGRWPEALRLGRAIEGALGLAGRWETWAHVLQGSLQAAEAGGNALARAWALHQLGTRAMALDDVTTARAHLARALRLRESLADWEGAAVTRHNLQILLGPPPVPPSSAAPPSSPPAPGYPWLFMGLLLPGLLLALGAWLLLTGRLPGLVSEAPSTPAAPVTALAFDPGELVFAAQAVGTGSPPRTVTLANTGSAALAVAGVEVTGLQPGDFVRLVDSCTGQRLEPGGQCAVTLSFMPQALGLRAANLVIAAGPTRSYTVRLLGTGIAQATAQPAGRPAAGLEPASLAFAGQPLGSGSDTRAVSVTSAGETSLRIDRVSLAGDFDFQVTADDCSGRSLSPGQRCLISLTFSAQATGGRAAELLVASNAPDSPVRLPLAGAGLAPGLAINPAGLDFGDQPVGRSSPGQDVTLANTGSAALVVDGVSLAGAQPNDFAVATDGCSQATLAPGSTCVVGLAFSPTAAGERQASLIVSANTPDNPPPVPLQGRGTAPALQLDPDRLVFGPQPVNTSSPPAALRLTNAGSAPLTLAGLTPGGANPADFLIQSNCPAGGLAAGSACAITVQFRPVAPGERRATLTLASNAPNSPAIIQLNGAGLETAPELRLNPALLTFGDQPLRTASAGQTASLTNAGPGPVQVTRISLAGPHTGDFTLADTCTRVSLAPGDSCLVTVRFVPTTPGGRSANLAISSNALGSPQLLALNGTGLAGQPDLVVELFASAGQPYRNDANEIEVPLRLVVRNQGTSPASQFRVSIEARPANSPASPVIFRVPGQDNTPYPLTDRSLPAGQEVTFTGIALISSNLDPAGGQLFLRATADSCLDGAPEPGYCRVDESEEANNFSEVLAVTAPDQPLPACIDFEDLADETTYMLDDRFNSGEARLTVKTFYEVEGNPVQKGFTRVTSTGRAGGAGHELAVNNVTLDFDFGRPLPGLAVRFGHSGGRLNLDLNGEFLTLANFADIAGQEIGGVMVSVDRSGNSTMGILRFDGTVNVIALGGQELWLDEVCPRADR